MKFRYKKFAPCVLRPVIPIEVSYKNQSIKYEVLVDSGADKCLFDVGVADILGIDLNKCEKGKVTGIVGREEVTYSHEVEISVGGWPFHVNVGFVPNLSRDGFGVVGQRGFFEIFIVKFDLLKEVVELKQRFKN